MTEEEETRLKDRINTVFNSEASAYRILGQGRSHGRLGTFSVGVQTGVSLAGQPQHHAIQSRSADTLLRLYSTLDDEGKGIFTDELLKTLQPTSQHPHMAYLSYFVLYRTGERVMPFQYGLEQLGQDSLANFSRGNLIAIVSQVLTHEYDQFEEGELDEIVALVSDLQYDNGITNKITEAKMHILESELSDVNPAINTDRDEIVKFWGEVFSSQTIPSLVAEIEGLFADGAFDEVKLATCLGRVRVLLIDSLKDLAAKIASQKNLDPLPSGAHDADVINWFKEKGVLTAEEKKLVRAMYDLCSNEGSHAAVSKREYARIAKNVTYECIVMLTGLVSR